MRGWKRVCKSRAVIRIQVSIYDGTFFAKVVNSFQLFLQKASIIDVRLGSKHASEKTETLKMKLRLAKSSQLLQRAAFLVFTFYWTLCGR